MNKARLDIAVFKLIGNDGRLDWLPTNPRQWTREDLEKTARSIEEDPDFLEDRPLLAVPFEDGKYIVFAGNLRLTAIKDRKQKTAPVVVYFPETEEDQATIKRRAMKDNGSFGAWDFDTLANEWSDLPLTDWGVPAWDEEKEEEMKATEELSNMTFDSPYYEPENIPKLKLSDCFNLEKFNAKIKALDEFDLTQEQRETLEVFAYRFIKIDFEKVATYYAFNASEEEKKAIERLRLVLVDSGTIRGFIEDDMIKIATLTNEQLAEIE